MSVATVNERPGVTSRVSSDAADVAERLLDTVVLVRSRGGSGSGVIWDPDGLIVTNNHVVRGEGARIILRDGAELGGRVVARDPGHDLAALRVDAQDLPAAQVGDSSRLRVGQMVLAAGNPLGLRGVVTAGIVTGAGQVTEEGGRVRLEDLIQADVSLAPGNSGGPLADAEGRVLGINSMISSSGIALAIPSAVVQEFLSPERTTLSYVGIRGVAVRVRMGGGERGGLLLISVEEGSPADRSGLLQGDVLLEVNENRIQTVEDFRNWLGDWPSGNVVQLLVLRGGEPRDFSVVPVARAAA